MTSMKVAVGVLMLVLAPIGCAAEPATDASVPMAGSSGAGSVPATGELSPGMPRYPTISPDGRVVVFSWAGDLWAVEAEGGGALRGRGGGEGASRLTVHPAEERRSAFSPDGRLLAFESERGGPRNVYIMELTRTGAGIVAGPVKRVTMSDRSQELSGFSADGRFVLLTGRHEASIYRSQRMYRAPVDADGPIERMTNAFGLAPHQSPDGSSIVFTRGWWDFNRPAYRGPASMDLWRLDATTNQFTRMTTDPANDGDGYPSADGSVVFVSSRDGQNNIWKLGPGADEPSQLTHFAPTPEQVTIGHGVRDLSVDPSGKRATFVVWDTIYTLDLTRDGAEPAAVGATVSADTVDMNLLQQNLGKQVSQAVLSPDGQTVAVVARGEVFVRATEEDMPTRRVTFTAGRERDLAWSPDGRVLYFASDESGVNSIYRATVTLTRDDLAPTPTPPSPPSPPSQEPKAKKPGAGKDVATQPDAEATGDDSADENADDGDDGDSSDDEADEEEEKVDEGARWAGSLRFAVEPVVDGTTDDRKPMPSPDGKKLLFVRGLGDLVLRDLATGSERVVLESWDQPMAEWAPDSQHIVYSVSDLDFNTDIWLADTAGDEPPVNLTRHPDQDQLPRLSADGKVLVFLSDRDATENWQLSVYAINLDRKLDAMRPYELAEYYKEASGKAKKRKPIDTVSFEPAPAGEEEDDAEEASADEPLVFDVEDAYLRVRRLSTLAGEETQLAITPAGDRVVFAAVADGKAGLYSVDYKGEERKTIQTGTVSSVGMSLTGSKAVYVSGGQAKTSPPAGGKAETLGIDAPVIIDIASEQRQKFIETARTLGAVFYHPTLKGLDWPGLTGRYLQLATGTRCNGAFQDVAKMLFGELNGSHTGIWGGRSHMGAGANTGYLGVRVEPADNGYRVTSVAAHSPARLASSPIEVGDVVVAINGQALSDGQGPTVDYSAALAGTNGKETLLELARADESKPAHVLVVPINWRQDMNLWHDEIASRRRQQVEDLSGGKLGYLHIQGMNLPSVRAFERELYAAANGKAGLIIDVRDNGGGWTTDILLASLTAPRHAYTIPRGADPDSVPTDAYPATRRLIYGYSRPISVLCNENSFSNAEIFSHAIKTIGRGTIVGTQTFGGVISTGAITLIDGTTVRTPFRGWYLPDGTDMENHGCVPDIEVPITPDDEVAGNDPQLEAAVRELLDRTGR